jgi:c-di-GMP-binding flagellar brake protein YcgR
MEISRVFRPNRRVSLGIKRKNEKGEEVVSYYPSRIELVREEEFWVAAPQEKGVLVPIGVGEKLSVYILGEKEIFHFEGEAKSRLKKENMAFLILNLPREVEREQRRNYVRIDVVQPLLIKKDGKSFFGYTKNLSGGGMLASFPDINIIGKAEVARKDDPYSYAFQFVEITDQDREEIIRYIFKQQIELRKKGLLLHENNQSYGGR